MEIFRRYKLVIKILNSTVLNKLKSYSQISALGPEGHCTSRFRRAMCISCRLDVDAHKWGGGLAYVDKGRGGQKSDFFWTSYMDSPLGLFNHNCFGFLCVDH